MTRRVAVVGRGVHTALGAGFGPTWEALLAGRSGVGPIRRFDASRYPVGIAAEVGLRGAGPGLYARLVDSVLAEALAGLHLDAVPPERRGVFMGNEAVRPEMGSLVERVHTGRPPTRHEMAAHHPAVQTLRIARKVQACGAVSTISSACTSSGQALGEALLAVRRGEVDLALAGGVDLLVHPLMITGFARLGALSTRNRDPQGASRPFDLDRDGFVLGEGAGLVVLVAEEVAEQVGPLLGWLTGYGCSCNAWRITDSPPDGRGAAQAMSAALADAGLVPEQVAYVNAHGTSTVQNDVSEARAIQRVLGQHTAVSSTKSMTAHMVAAGGAIEALVALQAVCQRVAPPTINLHRVDPDCVLDHVAHTPRELRPGAALSNAFGFGGSNATVVLEAP